MRHARWQLPRRAWATYAVMAGSGSPTGSLEMAKREVDDICAMVP